MAMLLKIDIIDFSLLLQNSLRASQTLEQSMFDATLRPESRWELIQCLLDIPLVWHFIKFYVIFFIPEK